MGALNLNKWDPTRLQKILTEYHIYKFNEKIALMKEETSHYNAILFYKTGFIFC